MDLILTVGDAAQSVVNISLSPMYFAIGSYTRFGSTCSYALSSRDATFSGDVRAVGAATVTTVLTAALFYGKVIIIHVHNNNNDVTIKYSSMAR